MPAAPQKVDRQLRVADAVRPPGGEHGGGILAPRSVRVVADRGGDARQDSLDGGRLRRGAARERPSERVALGRGREGPVAGVLRREGGAALERTGADANAQLEVAVAPPEPRPASSRRCRTGRRAARRGRRPGRPRSRPRPRPPQPEPRRAARRATSASCFRFRGARDARDFSTPSRMPLMNWEDLGVENRLAISSASSITTGRGVSGSCSSSKSASRRMFRSTTGIRASRQWSACREMIASRSSRCGGSPRRGAA